MFSAKAHHHIYFWSAIVVVIGLSLGKIFMSIGTISIFINWLIQGGFKSKLSTLKLNKVALSILAVFSLHLLGLLWSSDFDYAFHDLKIKAPILALILVFGSVKIFDSKQFKTILLTFVSAALTSVCISIYTYLKLSSKNELFDLREISIFISQIRQSLMVVFSIVILIYYSIKSQINKIIATVFILFFIGYLLMSASLTGLALVTFFLLTSPFWVLGFNKKSLALTSFIFVIFGVAFFFLSRESYNYYFTPKEVANKSTTSLGNLYAHNLNNNQLENGFYVGRNLAEQELKEGWENRSKKPYLSISGALIRYLTSEGLMKDAEALNSLSEKDIKAIENKKTSSRKLSALATRIDEFYFEMAILINNQNPSHNSIGQRFYAWKMGIDIIKENPFFGVGNGDIKTAFEIEYNKSEFDFSKKIRAHNQFITFFIAFGLIGGTLCLVLLIFPLIEFRFQPLALAFYIIILLSFLTEDTLETQPGVLFTAFFTGMFLNEKLTSGSSLVAKV